MESTDKLKEIFMNLFLISSEDIHEKLSPDDVDNWDSMQHLNLILAIEEEFKVSVTPEESTEMLNFELSDLLIKEKLKKVEKS
jgi:acyl carrier protein